MKPFKGIIQDWQRMHVGEISYIIGKFRGHAQFDGIRGYTSIITSMHTIAGNTFVETMNSIYLLVNEYKEETP